MSWRIGIQRQILRRELTSVKPYRTVFPCRAVLRSSAQSTRSYARYSRFEDDEDHKKQEPGEDPIDRDFRRKFEAFRLYGTGALLAGGGTIWYITHLEQVPETKRWRYMDVSERMRKMLEQQSYDQLMSEIGQKIVPAYHPATKWVQGVAEKLIAKNGLGHVVSRPTSSQTEQKDDEWLVYVVDEDIPNAFVIPGRKIVVFSGMLKHVEDEDQLAGILAHEVAHQLVGHVLEKVSLTRLIVVMDIALQVILGTNTNLGALALQFFIGLPNSRTQELEADLVGLRLMSKACFEPNAVVKFWQSFEKQDKRQPPQILSTHPAHRQRARAIEGWIPDVRSQYPCVDSVEFAQMYNLLEKSQQESSGRKPSLFSLTPTPSSRPLPSPRQGQRQQPSPSPGSEGSGWGHSDPWSSDSGSSSDAGQGSEANWGTGDPWAEKEKANSRKSW